MVTVTVRYLEGKYEDIKIEGHANSAPYGQDLVCAAVSAVSVGAVNSALMLISENDFYYRVLNGYVNLCVKNNNNIKLQNLMEVLHWQLISLSKSHPNFIRVLEAK